MLKTTDKVSPHHEYWKTHRLVYSCTLYKIISCIHHIVPDQIHCVAKSADTVQLKFDYTCRTGSADCHTVNSIVHNVMDGSYAS